MSKLANEYKGKVTFLGLSDESVETVGAFLEKKSNVDGKTWKQAMEYTVATDPDLSVKKDIFTAAGRTGIPSTFIISGGKVQWIGHPMSMDQPLEQIVAGTWDLAKAKKDFAAEAEVSKMMSDLRGLFGKAMESGEWGEVIAFLDQGLEKFPENTNLMMTRWNVLLLFSHRDDEAYAYGSRLAEEVWDDAQMLNQIAWTVVDDERVQTRDLKFALRIAERANELSESKEGAIMDTLARVHYESGRLDEAITWQRRAVAHAEGEMKAQLQEVLAKYEKEKKGEKGKSY